MPFKFDNTSANPMGWSFRKSFSLLPGVRLNLSRRGVSASFGIKGARLLIGSGRKPRITIGRGPFRYTQTLGGNTMRQPEPPSRAIAPVPAFDLPPRGRYEANATIFQKRKLEQFAAERGADLPERFYELIDTLGRDQAQYIINYYELRVSEQELAQAEAERAAEEAFEAERQRVEAIDRRRANKQLLWAIPYAVAVIWGVFYFTRHHPQPTSQNEAIPASPPKASTFAPSTTLSTTSTRPVPPAATPSPPQAFLADVRYSQQAAIAKYPELGIAGSPFNKRFLARYAAWQAQHDPRLQRSDWPEKVAADCSDHP